MGIKTVPQPPYIPDLTPCDFWLFPKLRGCRYETIGEMKEVVTKVIDTFTQEDFHRTFKKLLVRHNKCIAAGGDYFGGDSSFMCVLSIKVPNTKKVWKTYLMILVYIYIYIYINLYIKSIILLVWKKNPDCTICKLCKLISGKKISNKKEKTKNTCATWK